MHNKTGFNRLDRKPSHRRAMLRNMVMSLLEHEHITTTKAKAREACRKAEKMITRAKVDTVHHRRLIARDVNDKELVKKIFSELAPRYSTRNGGYTRIIKLGMRQGDAAHMVLLELVDRPNGFDSVKNEVKKSSTKKIVTKKTINGSKKNATAITELSSNSTINADSSVSKS